MKIRLFFVFALVSAFFAVSFLTVARADTFRVPHILDKITAADLGVESAGALPASDWYFLKEWRRGVERFFTFNPIKKAELELRIANEKAAEALKTRETGPDDDEALKIAFENYAAAQERLRARLADIAETSENPNVEELLRRVDEKTMKHAVLFNQLTDSSQAARDNHLQGAADIAQKKIQEIVVIAAEKDKNIKQKAAAQIERAKVAIGEWESELAEFVSVDTPRQTPKTDFGDRMKSGLETANSILAKAEFAFAEGKFGEAFGQARAAEVAARNGLWAMTEEIEGERTEEIAPNEAYEKKLRDLEECGPQPGAPGNWVCEDGGWILKADGRVFPETNNGQTSESDSGERTFCDGASSSACPRGEISECRNGKWTCVGPATGTGQILIPDKEVDEATTE